MNDLHKAFRHGAETLARGNRYNELHRSYGLLQVDWELLTTDDHWSPDDARKIRGILASVIETALTIAGMPAVPLPGQYAAAVIACVVSPVNRLLACTKVPETFDAVTASGLMENVDIVPMRLEQMMALVIAYSGGFGGEPMPRVAADVHEIVKKGNEK